MLSIYLSFSAVSRHIFVTKYSFCSIFDDFSRSTRSAILHAFCARRQIPSGGKQREKGKRREHYFAPFLSEVEKPWKTHLEDLPNAAAFAAKAAEKNQGCKENGRCKTRDSDRSELRNFVNFVKLFAIFIANPAP